MKNAQIVQVGIIMEPVICLNEIPQLVRLDFVNWAAIEHDFEIFGNYCQLSLFSEWVNGRSGGECLYVFYLKDKTENLTKIVDIVANGKQE